MRMPESRAHNYGDLCGNDPAHGQAVVGINNPKGGSEALWVCMTCFEEVMAATRAHMDAWQRGDETHDGEDNEEGEG